VDDTLYCGITNDLDRRTAAHGAGQVKYTRGRRPVMLVWTEPAPDRAAASRREWAVKRLDRTQKLALVAMHAADSDRTAS
jgi:putative endonuclease